MTDRTAAERARRGMICLSFEVNEVEHVEMLLATGFLSPLLADDRGAITEATRRLNERLTAVRLDRHG